MSASLWLDEREEAEMIDDGNGSSVVGRGQGGQEECTGAERDEYEGSEAEHTGEEDT